VLAALAALLIAVAFVSPAIARNSAVAVARFGTRLQFMFFAVAVSSLVTEVIKWCVGRGRPFVGGEANVFNFSHFAGTPAYSSFPSGHARQLLRWPSPLPRSGRRARVAMSSMRCHCASRLVLLAHHPSDVVAGALVGIIGAMFVRYWFAARRSGLRSSATAPLCRCLAPRWAPQKGCPGRFAP
jgi:membrane-associated phospholipid phosphatase